MKKVENNKHSGMNTLKLNFHTLCKHEGLTTNNDKQGRDD